MAQQCHFHGLRNASDVSVCLQAYDDATELPVESECSFTAYFFPNAYRLSGFRLQDQELADTVQAIWQQYAFEQTHVRPHIKIDRAYSQVLEMVHLYLDEKQQVQLARHIVGERTDRQLRKYVEDAREFRQEVQIRFRTLAKIQLSPALHNASEELGIGAGRFDGLPAKMKAVLGKLGLRELEPIADPDLFIYELSEHFEVVKGLLPELTKVDQNLTDTETKINNALNDIKGRKRQALELTFQLCERIAKLQRWVETITNPPQKSLGELDDALEQQRKRRKRKRIASSSGRKRSAGEDESW
jgi:hypothetical protein